MAEKDKKYFFDKKDNIRKIIFGYCLLCLCLLIADFVIHRHIYHDWEKLPGFYAIFGFASYTALVFLAAGLRKLVMRPENYYDEKDAEK